MEACDNKLIVNAFLHAIRTLLIQESVRNHILPYVKESTYVNNVDYDNFLLPEVNKAMFDDNTRTHKLLRAKKKSVSVNHVNKETLSKDVLTPLLQAIHDTNKGVPIIHEDLKLILEKGIQTNLLNKPATKNNRKVRFNG